MNHCLIQSVIKTNPQMRYTKENQTPIAEMIIVFKGLRNEDPLSELKVIGWGSVAQEMVDFLKEGQNIIVEGRLRMNSIERKDGTKEKQAEITASRIHHITPLEKKHTESKDHPSSTETKVSNNEEIATKGNETSNWNSSPLVPDVDEIPF
tara:strand:- start:510 stop:962 length:453 start_codon:yes stop_codon:yes gene_type:complete